MIVRHAALEDEVAALILIEELFEEPGIRAPGYTTERGRAGFHSAVENKYAEILLACDGNRIVGLASVYADILSIRYGPRCWLQDLIVTPDSRGRGAGKALLDAATDWARDRGCTHLELASGAGRLDAHRFYLREGMAQSYNFSRQID